MKYLKQSLKSGIEQMATSSVTICSIVRNCNNGLKKNIKSIEVLRSYFKESNVIVFENDSTDGTKERLLDWKSKCENVYIYSDNYMQDTIPKTWNSTVNKYYSNFRISKMAEYRNQYMQILDDEKLNSDFVIVVDLDVAKLNINGIIHSFSLANNWDVICSNGISSYPIFKKRYYDTYALVELGMENAPQTVNSIQDNRSIWSFLKPGLPLIPVYSAYGGLAIYRFEAIKGKRYSAIKNNDDKVEVKCEHFSICHEIRNAGFSRIYINPNMLLKYQGITFKLIFVYILRLLNIKKV